MRPFLLWPVEVKLRNMPLIVSHGRYLLDESSSQVHFLLRLFRLRNRMLHIAQHWEDVGVDDDDHISPYYASEEFKTLTMKNLREMKKVYELAIRYLGHLWPRINRKNFNPAPWLRLNDLTAGEPGVEPAGR